MEEFKWEDELTFKFIELRNKREHLFDRKEDAKVSYEAILKEMKLEGSITAQEMEEKWHSLVTEFTTLKKAMTGHDVGKYCETALSWKFFKVLDEHLGCGSIDLSPVASSSNFPNHCPPHELCSPNSKSALTESLPSTKLHPTDSMVPDALLSIPRGINVPPSSPFLAVTSSSLPVAEVSSYSHSSEKENKTEEVLKELVEPGREKFSLSGIIDTVVNKNVALSRVNEYGIKLLVDSAALSPRKSGAFYNRELSVSRALVFAALAAYIESGKSVVTPIRVLDGVGATGILGLILRKQFDGTKVEVTINDPNEESCAFIKSNAALNNLKIEVTNRDTCALMHERIFNFIYLDCHTSAAHYFDAVFRNIPKHGIFIVTTSDDPALYGRTPEIAMRNYGGEIVKTAYFKELAVRLVLAAMTRSAARFNKAVKMLCCMSVKASFTLIVEVIKGAAKANDCLQMVQSMLHCSFCEDWAFLPKTQYPIENPTSLLRCDCRHKCPGKTASCIGPIWSGPIFDSDFISAMIGRLSPKNVNNNDLMSPLNCLSIASMLELLYEEALCRKTKGYSLSNKREAEEESGNAPKKQKSNEWLPKGGVIDDNDKSIQLSREIDRDPEAAPAFYLSLHRRVSGSGGHKLPRADSAVIRLREAGFRASRTHFDPYALRTNALPSDLWKLLGIK